MKKLAGISLSVAALCLATFNFAVRNDSNHQTSISLKNAAAVQANSEEWNCDQSNSSPCSYTMGGTTTSQTGRLTYINN